MSSIAGIGSRDWSREQLLFICDLSRRLSQKYYQLYTGNAYGSDNAFAEGWEGDKVIQCLPWPSYNSELLNPSNIVYHLHRVWEKQVVASATLHWSSYREAPFSSLSQAVQKLMARNYMIVSGRDEVYAAPRFDSRGKVTGGTAFGIHIAKELLIPVNIIDFRTNQIHYNYYNVGAEESLSERFEL